MEEIRRIQSFEIDHDLLDEGMYISRTDGDITTFDMRTRKPNNGDYMDNVTMHSMEHMFATYIRNSAIGQDVIYFGPMGCRTGFYLLVRNADKNRVFEETKKTLEKIIAHKGPVFGATRKECGNYRELDIKKAQDESLRYLDILMKKGENDFTYRR